MRTDPPAALWIDTVNALVDLSPREVKAGAEMEPPALATLAKLARRLLGSHACTVTRVDQTSGHLTTVASEGPSQAFDEAMRGHAVLLAAAGAIDPEAISRGDIVERYDLQRDGQGGASEAFAVQHGLQSVLCLPLKKRNDEVIGYINHFSASNEPFAPLTRQILEMFARQAVAAIDRIEWQETLGRSVNALNRLSKNFLDEPDDFMKQAADAACGLLSVPVCVIWQRAEHEEKVTVAAASDTVDEQFKAIELPLDSPGVKQVITSRDVKSILDIRKHSPFYQHSGDAASRGWVSLVTAPMMVGDRLIGLLDMYTTSERRFEPWEKKFVGVFANFVALAIWTFVPRKRLQTLNELMISMTEAASVDKVLDLFLHGGLKIVGATRGWISLVDLRTGYLEVGLPAGNPTHPRTLKWGEGVTGTAVKEGRTIRIGDVTSPEWQGIYVPFWPDTLSELAVPIMLRRVDILDGKEPRSGAKPIGVLNIESPRRNAFTENAEKLMWSLAQHAAIVIEKLKFDERLAKLEELERDMGQLDTPEKTGDAVAGAVEALGYDFVNVSLVRPEEKRIKTEFMRGIEPAMEEEFKRMANHRLDSDDIQADIVRQGVAEAPAREDPRFDPKIYERFGHGNLVRVFVPMRLPQGNRVVGTIEAGYNQKYRRHIYQRDVKMLQGLADYAALALEHKKIPSFNLYLAALLKKAMVNVGATQGAVLMVGDDNKTLEVIEALGRPYGPGQVKLEIGVGVGGVAVQKRRPVYEPDIDNGKYYIRSERGEPTFRSMLAVPLLTGDRCIGAICVNGERVDQFNQAHIDSLVALTRQVAPHIDNFSVKAFIGHSRRLNQLERFRGVSEEFSGLVRDLPRLRKQIVKSAVIVLEADSAVLYEYYQKTDTLVAPPTVSGDIADIDAMAGQIQKGRAPHLIITSGEPYYSEHPGRDAVMSVQAGHSGANPDASSFVEREGIVSSAGMPLKVADETFGVLFLNFRRPHAFSEHEKHVFGGFAAAAAVALQAARAVRDDMAKSHDSALQENRAVMAHRLKGPLISMKRRIDDIYEACLDMEIRHLALQASQLNRHAQEIVAEFNTAAKKHPFFARVKRTERDALELLISETLTLNKTHDDTKASVSIDSALPAVALDRETFRDDLIGLLHDSERHRPAGAAVSLEIGTARSEDLRRFGLPVTHAFVKIVYRDNGPGIPPEDKERIFEQVVYDGRRRHRPRAGDRAR